MLSLSLKFPAGRYHATPWDRHVNEGAVAWPPEPLRLMRALIATWYHKVRHSGRHEEVTLQNLIESLAQELPHYAVPAASHSHTRHYMPQRHACDTSLILDGFAAVARDEPLYVTWPKLDLSQNQAALLDDLLGVLGYLGRAESWVDAVRIADPRDPNCMPGDRTIDPSTGEVLGEVVTLFAPLPAAEYRAMRARFLKDKSAAKALGSTLPETLLSALTVDTAALRKGGWSQPPAARRVQYLRPIDALRPKRATRTETLPNVATARYLLVGKPLPTVEESVRMGELLRLAVMSQAKHELGEHAIPPVFSGHDLPDGNRHQHAFYLPWDANGDGRIDRLLLHVPAGMGATERRVVEKVQRIWSHDDREWRVVLEGIGNAKVGGALMDSANEWQSITPYLHPWHVKKGFTVEDQICRECRERGLPEPVSLERLDGVLVGEGKQRRHRRPIHFKRFRTKWGLNQPDRQGSFWHLRFAERIPGPLALGFACHFGLGLFAPRLAGL
jgi:CRISPR-associated protein Csb2